MYPLLGCQHHHHQEAWNMSSCTSCGVFYGKRRLQSINHCHPDTPMHKRSRTQYHHTTTTPTNQHPMQQNRPPLLAPLQNPNHVQPSFGRACRVPKIPPLPLQNPGHVLPPEGLISSSKQQTGHDDATGLEFDHAKLKERQESAIRSLYADLPRQCATCGLRFKTQGEHGQHMDWHVRKNRAAKSKSKQMQARKWFPSSSFLLKASEANGISNAGTPAFFATSTVEEENNFVEQLAVFADEDQRECPLCMETFDDYFSNETNDWMYRGTVYMNEAKASTRRLYKSLVGRIVHAKCHT